MELIIVAFIVGIGLLWYFGIEKRPQTQKQSELDSNLETAPYKIESPTITEIAASAEIVDTIAKPIKKSTKEPAKSKKNPAKATNQKSKVSKPKKPSK